MNNHILTNVNPTVKAPQDKVTGFVTDDVIVVQEGEIYRGKSGYQVWLKNGRLPHDGFGQMKTTWHSAVQADVTWKSQNSETSGMSHSTGLVGLTFNDECLVKKMMIKKSSVARPDLKVQADCQHGYRWCEKQQECRPGNCPGCFPGTAQVRVPNSEKKEMISAQYLNLTNKVFVPFGGHDEVYFDGHRFPTDMKKFEYVSVTTLDSKKTIKATAAHLIGVWNLEKKKCNSKTLGSSVAVDEKMYRKCAVYIAFKDFVAGVATKKLFYIFVVRDDGSVWTERVDNGETKIVSEWGMNNPRTLSGLVVVEDVLVSAHTLWPEGPVHFWWPSSLEYLLHDFYQMLFAPIRALYRMFPAAFVETDKEIPFGTGEYPLVFVIGSLLKHCWWEFVENMTLIYGGWGIPFGSV